MQQSTIRSSADLYAALNVTHSAAHRVTEQARAALDAATRAYEKAQQAQASASIALTAIDTHTKAPGAELSPGSVWAALNAVTFYATHVKTCRDTSGSGVEATRYASNLDGDAATMKVRALLLALSFIIGD